MLKGVLHSPVDPIELPRRLCVRLCILSSNRKTHSMPTTNVTTNHTLVSNVLQHLSSFLRLDLQFQEWVLRIQLRGDISGYGRCCR